MFFLFVSGLHKKGKGLEEKLLQPNTRMSAAEMLHFYLRTSIQFLLYHCGPFKTDELQTYHQKNLMHYTKIGTFLAKFWLLVTLALFHGLKT